MVRPAIESGSSLFISGLEFVALNELPPAASVGEWLWAPVTKIYKAAKEAAVQGVYISLVPLCDGGQFT